jgi:ferredoxin
MCTELGTHFNMTALMKIVVDRGLCEANRMCMRTVPEVFCVDEDDHLHLLVEHINSELRVKVEQAVECCPRQALSIIEKIGQK